MYFYIHIELKQSNVMQKVPNVHTNDMTFKDFFIFFHRKISAFVCAQAQYLNTSRTVQHATYRVGSLLTTANVVGTASTACTKV